MADSDQRTCRKGRRIFGQYTAAFRKAAEKLFVFPAACRYGKKPFRLAYHFKKISPQFAAKKPFQLFDEIPINVFQNLKSGDNFTMDDIYYLHYLEY